MTSRKRSVIIPELLIKIMGVGLKPGTAQCHMDKCRGNVTALCIYIPIYTCVYPHAAPSDVINLKSANFR